MCSSRFSYLLAMWLHFKTKYSSHNSHFLLSRFISPFLDMKILLLVSPTWSPVGISPILFYTGTLKVFFLAISGWHILQNQAQVPFCAWNNPSINCFPFTKVQEKMVHLIKKMEFTAYLLCASCCHDHSTLLCHRSLTATLWGRDSTYPHFRDKEIKRCRKQGERERNVNCL